VTLSGEAEWPKVADPVIEATQKTRKKWELLPEKTGVKTG
jgi:hypothetical protein